MYENTKNNVPCLVDVTEFLVILLNYHRTQTNKILCLYSQVIGNMQDLVDTDQKHMYVQLPNELCI